MNKKTIAITLEIIPIISAIISCILFIIPYDTSLTRKIVLITTILAFLGFVFFVIGRKLCKENKLVKILGILDWLGTLYVIGLYTVAIFVFGL